MWQAARGYIFPVDNNNDTQCNRDRALAVSEEYQVYQDVLWDEIITTYQTVQFSQSNYEAIMRPCYLLWGCPHAFSSNTRCDKEGGKWRTDGWCRGKEGAKETLIRTQERQGALSQMYNPVIRTNKFMSYSAWHRQLVTVVHEELLKHNVINAEVSSRYWTCKTPSMLPKKRRFGSLSSSSMESIGRRIRSQDQSYAWWIVSECWNIEYYTKKISYVLLFMSSLPPLIALPRRQLNSERVQDTFDLELRSRILHWVELV